MYAISSAGSPTWGYPHSIRPGGGPHGMFPPAMSPCRSTSRSLVLKLELRLTTSQCFSKLDAAATKRVCTSAGSGSRTHLSVELIDSHRATAYKASVCAPALSTNESVGTA